MHSHRTLLAEVVHIRGWITPGSPNLMGSPVTHATGMLGAVLAPMELGEDIHLIDRWDPDRVLDVMLEADVGAGTGASVFLASLLDHPDFTPEHARAHPPRRPGRRAGAGRARGARRVARHRDGARLRIDRAPVGHGLVVRRSGRQAPRDRRPPDDRRRDPAARRRRRPVGVGEPGEIWSRGPDLCLGYTDPALTAEAFDADGWYRSGDMGVLDADGFLTITDRVKDVIIRGGENISAAEVEEAIAALPQVAEVAVVAAPDERLGEHACAVVRLAPGVESLELRDITAELERIGLARQKWPEELRIVDDFPRTASGKIRKVDLRRQLRAGAQ